VCCYAPRAFRREESIQWQVYKCPVSIITFQFWENTKLLTHASSSLALNCPRPQLDQADPYSRRQTPSWYAFTP